MSKPTRRITKEIKAELDRLAIASKGRLHWEDVVRAAHNKTSPLHSYFNWDQAAAMEAFLRAQAEELITGYYLTITNPVSGEKMKTRAYISLTSDRRTGGGYRSIMSVLSDAEMKQQMIDDAMADLAAFKQRYQHLQELARVFVEISKFERKQRPKKRR